MTRRTGKAPTMQDIATVAGVTQATVSYVLNNRGEVSESVRKRVLDTAEQLGYIPNLVARNFRMSKSTTLGLIVPDVTNSYYNEMIKHTEVIARQSGYFFFVCSALHNPELEDFYVTSLIQNQVAGVLVGYGLTNRDAVRKLQRYNIPFVVLDDDMADAGADSACILMNNVKGSFLAVQHFVSLGISEIAYITEPLYNLALRHRREGFHAAIEEFHLHCPAECIASESGEYDKITQGYLSAGEMLAHSRPQGIFVSTDQMALGVLKKLHDLRIRVPADIAVIGYDDIPVASIVQPTLTTISQPVQTMCILGTKMLLGLIDGDKDAARKMVLEPSVVVRESAPSNAPR